MVWVAFGMAGVEERETYVNDKRIEKFPEKRFDR